MLSILEILGRLTAASIVVESTTGEVAVCVTVRALVGGAERERTPVRELELLEGAICSLSGGNPLAGDAIRPCW